MHTTETETTRKEIFPRYPRPRQIDEDPVPRLL